jgi:hypothetical protein
VASALLDKADAFTDTRRLDGNMNIEQLERKEAEATAVNPIHKGEKAADPRTRVMLPRSVIY